MLIELPALIVASLNDLRNALPQNPQSVAQIAGKIMLLESPSLANDIIRNRLFVEAQGPSTMGRIIRLAAVFPSEEFRSEAVVALDVLVEALPVLENVMNTAFPADTVRVWYGFRVGSVGRLGVLSVEDRRTYESRVIDPRLPYDAILDHELAHSYIGNEALTQFLEMYAYNRLTTGSADPTDWVHTRGYVAMRDANENAHAVLDVYAVLGRSGMSDALHAVFPLHPPYGEPLSAAVRQVFVDRAPAGAQSLVDQKMQRITF